MLDFKSDLNILYGGGSGGFILLHLLLLQRRFFIVLHGYLQWDWYCNWVQNQFSDPDFLDYVDQHLELSDEDVPDNPQDRFQHKLNSITCYEHYLQVTSYWFADKILDNMLDHVIKQQWDSQRSTWKQGEFWPDNYVTQQFTTPQGFNKIYLTCNDISAWQSLPGHKVILYTDIRTQIRMSWFKKANWFVDVDKSLLSQKKLLRKLLAAPVAKNIQQAWDQADTHIKLQDLINYSNWPEPQLKLINEWKKQHPKNLLRKVGIK